MSSILVYACLAMITISNGKFTDAKIFNYLFRLSNFFRPVVGYFLPMKIIIKFKYILEASSSAFLLKFFVSDYEFCNMYYCVSLSVDSLLCEIYFENIIAFERAILIVRECTWHVDNL